MTKGRTVPDQIVLPSRPAEWGPWEWRNHIADRADHALNEIKLTSPWIRTGLLKCCLNQIYSVMFFAHITDWGQVDHLMIRRHDGQPVRSWTDLQRIKDELIGPMRTAIEVFPPLPDVVDAANLYHLWILPQDMALPFGLQSESMKRTLVRRSQPQSIRRSS